MSFPPVPPFSASPAEPTSPPDDLDPRFVCDFRASDEPGPEQRWSTWLGVGGAVPRPRAATAMGGHPGRRGRHRARHPQDRQGGRRVPRRARRPAGRRRARRRHGRQAVPQPVEHGSSTASAEVHRGPPRAPHARGQRAMRTASPPGAARSRPPSGPTPSSTPCAASGRRARRCPTRCRSTAPRCSWSSSATEDRRRRTPAGPRPAGTGAAGESVATSSARHVRCWPGSGLRARRPVAVQHPGRRRAAGHHRPAAGRGPGGQPVASGRAAAGLPHGVHLVPPPAGSTSTRTRCSPTCWPRPSDQVGPMGRLACGRRWWPAPRGPWPRASRSSTPCWPAV